MAKGAAFRVAVMAKYPRAGAVKTRLARDIGEAAAADLARAFVLDLHRRLRHGGMSVTWAYWPADAPFGVLLPDAACVPQDGGDLGERMHGVLTGLWRTDSTPVVLLGADLPHVDLAAVRSAGEALAAGEAEIVIGPATDGGYYLLGLRRDRPEIFRDLPWGSGSVYARTVRRCVSLGITPLVLPESFDVDDLSDLRRLIARLAVRDAAIDLPDTRAVLARHGLR